MPTFVPPTADTTPPIGAEKHPGDPLFRHYKSRACGRTVVKVGGVYQTVDYPTLTLLNSASEVYMGGHTYTVDTATGTALTAAGYTVI